MTTGVSLGLRRASAPVSTREELRRQLLALVLAFVLVWYTLVVPADAGAGSFRRLAPDDEGHDGEVRGGGSGALAGEGEPPTGDDLDWPEYIYP